MPGSVGRRRVTLFITCIVDQLYPEIGHAVVDILERHGVEVVFPADQTCCGQPAFNAGHWDDARIVARHNLDVLRGDDDIVAPSGSCTVMLRHSYAELFGDDAAQAAETRRLAARCFEFTEYLVEVLGITDAGAAFEGTLTMHDACHGLRGLHIKEPPRSLLRNVVGARFAELPGAEECCGFGGLFAIKLPQISEAMLERKIQQITATGAERVVTCDASCMTQINGRLSRTGSSCRAMHIAELLANRAPEVGR